MGREEGGEGRERKRGRKEKCGTLFSKSTLYSSECC